MIGDLLDGFVLTVLVAVAIDEMDACFVVRDGNGYALGYVYFERGRAGTALGGSPHQKRVQN